MADTRLGFVGTLPVGAWSNSTAYKYLDVVTYNGSSYVAKTETVPSGTLPTNTTYWQLMASKGDKGDTGEIISASATITNSFGTPTVVVTAGGTSTDRSFAFAFSNLKGNGVESVALLSTENEEKTYRMTFSDGTHFDYVVTDGEVTEESLAQTLEDYAQIDGYYEDLTSGSTEEVISNVKITDQEPYTFRTSGGNAEIGSREEDTLVGVSVAFNQLASLIGTPTKNFSDGDNYYGYINNVFSYDVTPVVGHKYFVSFDVTRTIASNNTIGIYFGGALSRLGVQYNNGEADGIKSSIVEYQSGSSVPKGIGYNNYNGKAGFESGDSFTIEGAQIADLTLAFGSDIADYLYTLEQAQAGEGVALAKKLGLNKYLGYNAGTLYSAQTDAHKMVGFNQFNKATAIEGKRISNGNIVDDASYYLSDYIPVIPNTEYRFVNVSNLYFYSSYNMFDANKNYIGYGGVSASSTEHSATGNKTLSSDCYYIRLNIHKTVIDDCCVSIHWDNSRDTDYDPYVLHNYPIDPVVLRGILKKDADGNIYADGDTYEADGTVTRKYGIVDLGTLNWSEYVGYPGLFYVNTSLPFKKPASNNVLPNAICGKYQAMISRDIGISGYTKGYFALASSRIYVADDTYTGSPSTFKTAVSGVYLVYELATPTTEQATPFTDPQIVDNWGTEEYPDYAVAQGDREYSVPMGHTTLYPISIRDKVEASADNPSNDGVYILQMSGGKATYIPLIIEDELPTAPTEDGTYSLKTVVSSGTATLSWVAE